MQIILIQLVLVISLGLFSFVPAGFSSLDSGRIIDKSDRIYWSINHRLTWDDFLGSPDYHNKFASAISSTGIVYKYRCDNGNFNVTVESMFIKSESWVKRSALTEYHLQHEQIHFDITELYARKLRKELSQKRYDCRDERQLEKLVNEKLQEWDDEQKLYDKATQHSLNEEEQLVWNELIKNELDIYSKYSSDHYYD